MIIKLHLNASALGKSPLDLRLFLNWRLPTSQNPSRHAKPQVARDNRSDHDTLFEKSMSLFNFPQFHYHFNIFIQDDHFSYSSNCYQHEYCVHNTKDTHNTGNFTPYSFRIVFGFFNVPHIIKHGRYCETGPTVYSYYPRRLESLTICWCNYKGSTFYSVILRPWVLVRPELNSRPPAWQTDAQSTEPPVCGLTSNQGSCDSSTVSSPHLRSLGCLTSILAQITKAAISLQLL